MIRVSVSCVVLAGVVLGRVEARELTSSDNGNGTFSNPVVWAGVSDLCVIQMDMSQGIPVMRLYDLVNGEIVRGSMTVTPMLSGLEKATMPADPGHQIPAMHLLPHRG